MSCIWPPGLHLRKLAPRSKFCHSCCHQIVPYFPIRLLSPRSQFGPHLATEIRYHLHYTEKFCINVREIRSAWHLHGLPLTNQWMNSCVGAEKTEEEALELHSHLHNQSTTCPALMLLCLCLHINILTYFTIGYYYWLNNSINMSSLQNTWLVVFIANESTKLWIYTYSI